MASICCSPPLKVPATCLRRWRIREEIEHAFLCVGDPFLIGEQEGATFKFSATVKRLKMRRPSGTWTMPLATM